MTLGKLPEGNQRTILVIDDESVTRMMVRQVLEESHYIVKDAQDGEEGLEVARDEMPDLVLLDVRMPRMNGFETCRALRELPEGRHVPILMLTGLDDVVSVQLAFESGATDFITKPINWALLAQRLRYALQAKQQEERLRESESRLAHAQQLARLGQWKFDSASGSVAMSAALADQLGFGTSEHSYSLREITARIHRRDRQRVLRMLRTVFETGEPADFEFQLAGSQGRLSTVHLFAEREVNNGSEQLQGTVQDVTARIEAEARISYFSHYDRLTDLPNRVLFWDRLTLNIAECRRSGKKFAVLLIDLDRFSALNASLGHAKGDRILQILAGRMAQKLRSSDTLSRIGGDEFAIIFQELDNEQDFSPLLARILACFEEPIQNDAFEAFVTASVGIALFPDDGEDLDTLLMNADAAKVRAEAQPGSSYQFYTTTMGDDARERIALEAALRHGLEDDAFLLHYQPLVSLQDSNVWGVETLLRWEHPDFGLVMPDVFIPILEETGMLREVGEWIVRRACEDHCNAGFRVSINLSPIQLWQKDLVARISRILTDTGFAPERLLVEITENVLIDKHLKATETIDELRRLGVKVAIDDYGTGFSSLAYLKRYHADILKVDRSFIGGLRSEKPNLAIVRSTITLGHDLDMQIIGEGVEEVGDLETLRTLGCDVAQGFLIAKPLALEPLQRWLSSR